MTDPDLFRVAAIALTFLLAGWVKGVIGLGLPTVAIGLLGLLLPPAEAAALLVVPSLVTNLWQALAGPGLGRLARRLWSMLLGVCVGTAAGIGVLSGDDAALAGTGLGVALIVYAVVGLTRVGASIPARMEAWAGPLAGGATGVITGATGVFVIPSVPYLQALGLRRDEFIQALGLSFTVSTVALAGGLAAAGVWHGALAAASLAAVLPAVAGMVLGRMVRGRVSADRFRTIFFLGVLGLGVHLAIRVVL